MGATTLIQFLTAKVKKVLFLRKGKLCCCQVQKSDMNNDRSPFLSY